MTRVKTIMKAALAVGLVLTAGSLLANSYIVRNTTAAFGTIPLPSTVSGTLLSTYSLNDGYYDTFTFTPKTSGSYTFSISFTKNFGADHSFKTTVYKGSTSQLESWNNAGGKTISLSAKQYYTVKVQMLSPSYYTTTKYSYKLSIGGGSYPPLSCKATDGTYQGYVNVSWSSVSGATSYRLMRSTSASYSTATKIYEGSSRSVNDKTAKLGYRYYYWVVYKKNGSWWKSENLYDVGYRGISITAYYPKSVTVGKTAKLQLKVNGSYVTSGVTVSPKSCSYWKIDWYKTSPYFAKVKGLKKGTASVKITYGTTVTCSVTVPIKVVK